MTNPVPVAAHLYYHLTAFTWYWIVWLLAFLIPELYWVFTNPANTLSREYWSFEHLDLAQPFDFQVWSATHWGAAGLVWLLFLWLSLHLPFGLLR